LCANEAALGLAGSLLRSANGSARLTRARDRPLPIRGTTSSCVGAGIGPAPGGPSNEEVLMCKLTEVERQERREADRKRSQDAVEALTRSDGWKQWLASRQHFHEYSLTNQLLIAMQLPEVTRVAGFKAWLKLRYAVRKGERSLRIWMPIPPNKKELQRWREAGSPEDEKPKVRFRLGPVFDRSQVEELPPPAEPVVLDLPITTVNGDDLEWALEPLVALAAELGASVVVKAMPESQGGFFELASGTIGLNAARSVNHRVKTLVHELGHALVRQPRGEDAVVFSYSEEELVVESVAFTVCGSLGLDTSGYSVPYLASWSERAPLETIHAAARTIDEIATRIENAVTEAEATETEATAAT
jgi:antirestriction protein ArdC